MYKAFCPNFRGDLSGETLTDWYEYRAKEIERLSRQADCALELIKLAMERNIQVDHILLCYLFM